MSNSQAIEDYAKAIYTIAAEREGLVQNGEVAERLGVAPATATAMLKRLAELGLVEYLPYKGVSLTAAGDRVALEVIRHHRLIEAYLAQALGMPEDRVHEEAEVLEHVLSEELEERIAAKLGDPTHDPHGDPIPTRDGRIDEGATESMSAVEVGTRGTFVRVSDADPEMLRYLAERGIAPGQTFEIVERQPFGGPVFARFGGGDPATVHVLGGDLVQAMRVEVAG